MKCSEFLHRRMKRSLVVHSLHVETHYAQMLDGHVAYLAGRCRWCRSDIAIDGPALGLATDDYLAKYGVERKPLSTDLRALRQIARAA